MNGVINFAEINVDSMQRCSSPLDQVIPLLLHAVGSQLKADITEIDRQVLWEKSLEGYLEAVAAAAEPRQSGTKSRDPLYLSERYLITIRRIVEVHVPEFQGSQMWEDCRDVMDLFLGPPETVEIEGGHARLLTHELTVDHLVPVGVGYESEDLLELGNVDRFL